jgi:hypothetical protein
MRPLPLPHQSDESGSTNTCTSVLIATKNPLEQATTVLSLIVVMLGGAPCCNHSARILTEVLSYHRRI